MQLPILSIVILTLNSEEFLGECLDSLAKVDPSIVEVVFVDGGSTDSTIGLIRQRFSGVTVLSAIGATIPESRNVGLWAARGQYILFLDSDDRLRSASMPPLLDLLRRESPAFVVANHARMDRSGHVFAIVEPQIPAPFLGLLRNPVGTLAVVCRRDLLLELSGFSPAYPVAEDYEMWLRVFETARGRKFDALLGDHRVREDSASQVDHVRTRLFSAKASLAAARRRKVRLSMRTFLLAYWSLLVLDQLRPAGASRRIPPLGLHELIRRAEVHLARASGLSGGPPEEP